ncbi:MAG: Gfo/Idh/MocA family oxidoreductase [Tannerella sp.]|jgi:predicted dehydrogenase|nr:Gfo/Idh/MocA family oxidoreductase [Tannerella sp.]
MKIRLLSFITACLFCMQALMAQQQGTPVRIGVDGLTHDHINGLLRDYGKRSDIQIVGIAEKNKALVERLAKRFGFDPAIVYDDLETMIEKTKPQGVVAFNSIFEHLHTVEVCAPRGIAVMVEKPLAVSSEHAAKMAELARTHHTMVLTNYETSWYPTNHKAREIAVTSPAIGDIRKVIVCDGHKGPREIGCSEEFLAWLTDPVLNGGGAVIDFGCYGANLMTWLMHNEMPQSVTAVLQTLKPDVYPKVDDQATIILAYPHCQAILQGSWNWPVDRKDMEIYGARGYVKALNANNLVFRPTREKPEESQTLSPLPEKEREPFGYFANLIKGELTIEPTDLASLENNLIVVKILDAARRSARENRTIVLTE